MKFCPECGKMWNGSNFCAECGKDLRSYINEDQAAKKMPKIENKSEAVMDFNSSMPFEVAEDFDPLAAFDNIANIGAQYDAKQKEQTSIDALSAFEVEKLSNGKYMITALKNTADLFVNIPDCVQIIGEGAFENCAVIEATLPEGLIKIGARAFANCIDLEKINFPKTLHIIEDEVFSGCKSLDVEAPKNVRIGKNVFLNTASDIRERAKAEEHESVLQRQAVEEAQEWLNKGLEYSKNNNHTEALKCFTKSAEKGNSEAQFQIGRYYHYHKAWTSPRSELLENLSLMEKWYKLAAENGNANGQLAMAQIYEFGLGVKKNQSQQKYWLQKAAQQGIPEAHYKLGDFYYYEQNASEALKWYRSAAELGYRDAQVDLGNILLEGDNNLPEIISNPSEAVKWYLKAAEQSYAGLEEILGDCYYNGVGVNLDYQEAAKWYKKDVDEFDYEPSMVKLGEMYLEGKGVKEDKQEAFRLFTKAAEADDLSAWNKLGECYQNGYGVEEDDQEALKCFHKASESGYAPATENIGHCYYWGYGVEQSTEEALKWYAKAEEQEKEANEDDE